MPRGQYDRSHLRAPSAGDVADEQAETGLSGLPEAETASEIDTDRARAERRERRRRDTGDLDRMQRMHLTIPTSVQERADREGKTLRWVLDEPGRQMQMDANDWYAVREGVVASAGKNTDQKLILMEKPKDWYEEDRKSFDRDLKDRERAIEAGGKTATDEDRGGFYQPATKNRISRGA